VKIIIYEDFHQSPKTVMSDVLVFLGLSEYEFFNWNVGASHLYPPMDSGVIVQFVSFSQQAIRKPSE